MIRAVLFDYCGVLTEGGKTGSIRQTIAALCNRDEAEIEVSDLHHKYVRNQITETEYFDEINRRYPCVQPVSAAEFLSNSQIYVRCDPVYELAEQLRGHGIRTGILSNMYDVSADKLRDEGFYEGFDPVVLSSTEKLAKPDKAFYQLALDRLGLPASEVLFIDDQAPYGIAAKEMGMSFILAVSPEQIIADVKALLKKTNKLDLN